MLKFNCVDQLHISSMMKEPECDAAAECGSVTFMEKPTKFGLNVTQN